MSGVGTYSWKAQGLSAGRDIIIGGGAPRLRVPVPGTPAPANYVDRPELTQPLLTHLLADQAVAGRAMISAVHGIGGIGKTTIARWLIWRPEVEQRFCDGRIWVTLGSEPLDALIIIGDWVSQLDPALKPKTTIEGARAELATLLQHKSILVVVDDVWPGRSAEVAKALLVASSRSRFLLTTRFPRLADDPEIRAMGFSLNEMSVAQTKEMITHILDRGLSLAEESLAADLCEAIDGHPFAIELAVARIREGQSWNTLLTSLRSEIADLKVLEEADDNLIELPISDRVLEKQKSLRASLLLTVRYLSREGQQFFAWLGAISEDATIRTRMAATLWATDEQTALKHLRNLTGAGILRAQDSVYGMHDLMHDLAREILTAPVIPARERDIPGLGLTLQEASRQLLERYRAKTCKWLWHTLPEDGYIHDYLVYHLDQANRGCELIKLLWEESADGHCGWYWARKHLGQTSGFVADVKRVWRYADRLVATAATNGDVVVGISLQLHCALIIVSINSLSMGIPMRVLLGSVRCRLITVSAALTFARQNPNTLSKVATLIALTEATPSGERAALLDEALSTALSIDDAELRGITLAVVAERLPAGQALTIARGIEDVGSRALALTVVAARLHPEEQSSVLDEAVNTARGIKHATWRARRLAAAAQRLPAKARKRVLGEALSAARGIDDAELCAQALAAVAERLPVKARKHVLSEALSVARGINDAELCARVLAAVAERLPAKTRSRVLGEAVCAARSIDDAQSRARALVAIAPGLRINEQQSAFEEALSDARGIDNVRSRMQVLAAAVPLLPLAQALTVARSIDDAELRAQALAAVAERLPAEEQQSVLGEALSSASNIDDVESRVRALVAVGLLLQAEAQQSVLGAALIAARGIDNVRSRMQVLAAVAPLLPVAQGLTVAGSIDDAELRGRALVEVAAQLPVGQALMVARNIEDVESRARVLVAVAARLQPEEQSSVLGEALNTARGIRYGVLRTRALVSVAGRLHPEEQSSVLGEALSTARGSAHAGSRALALAVVATQLLAEEQQSVLNEALMVARSIADAPSRAVALMAIATRLPLEQPNVLNQALVVARSIDDDKWCAQALAAVAERLPAREQQSVLNEALMVARSIADAPSRAVALMAIATRLPADQQPSVFGEALRDPCYIDNARSRTEARANVAAQRSAGRALILAGSIANAPERAQALAIVAQRLSKMQVLDFSLVQWTESIRLLAAHTRSDCTADLTAILPLINVIGGETTISNLARSLISVGIWWP